MVRRVNVSRVQYRNRIKIRVVATAAVLGGIFSFLPMNTVGAGAHPTFLGAPFDPFDDRESIKIMVALAGAVFSAIAATFASMATRTNIRQIVMLLAGGLVGFNAMFWDNSNPLETRMSFGCFFAIVYAIASLIIGSRMLRDRGSVNSSTTPPVQETQPNAIHG